MFFRILRLQRKKWILILISLTMFVNIWYMDIISVFMNGVTGFLTGARIYWNHQNTKHILFWNGYMNITDQTIQCQYPGDNCVYKVKPKNEQFVDFFADAIVFIEPTLNWSDIPKNRLDNQLYIFWCIEPSLTWCHVDNEKAHFFNWTFTYHLDSTVSWHYFVVQDRNTKAIVAPSKSVTWRDNEDSLKPDLKKILDSKTKAIVWITSIQQIDQYGKYNAIFDLQIQLKLLGLSIHVRSNCSHLNSTNNCDEIIKRDYRFYIAFEDYWAEDFVSSKVLGAYNNFAVPVVYGGANYRWFLPPRSYLDTNVLHPCMLAHAIKAAMSDPDLYASYFEWTNIYSIVGTDHLKGSHPLCSLCSHFNYV